jgi:myo-inositol 2-dehydrogenase/D-chiro-inositol 1-dehydrogenase/scyllo-inositol 2-dehydrogenase (NAD+)
MVSVKSVQLGIIGLGYVGQIHLGHGLRLANAEVAAVADMSAKALNKAKNAGVKAVFRNYEDLLRNPSIDAVVVALPTHLHLQCATQAAEARKHIFLEKPIARNVQEASEIVSVARKNSVRLMIGYQLRFNEKFRSLKRKVNDGTLGDVEIAQAAYISSGPFFHRAEGYAPIPVPEWWFNKELTGGGALIDFGSHVINLLRWYFGEIISINSCLGYRFNLDFEDSATCLAKFKSGTRAVMNVGWFLQGYQLKVEMYGTVGQAIEEYRPGGSLRNAVQMLTRGYSDFNKARFDELQYFVDCLANDTNPSPSGEEGLRDLEAIAMAYNNEMFPRRARYESHVVPY